MSISIITDNIVFPFGINLILSIIVTVVFKYLLLNWFLFGSYLFVFLFREEIFYFSLNFLSLIEGDGVQFPFHDGGRGPVAGGRQPNKLRPKQGYPQLSHGGHWQCRNRETQPSSKGS